MTSPKIRRIKKKENKTTEVLKAFEKVKHNRSGRVPQRLGDELIVAEVGRVGIDVHPHTIITPTKDNLITHLSSDARAAFHYASNKGILVALVKCGFGDPMSVPSGEVIPQKVVIVPLKDAQRLIAA